jgi:alpha-1,3-rhamnosyl/mannosyltransferase
VKAAVNLLWCRPGAVGGSEEYLARQLTGLRAVAPHLALRLVVPPDFADAHPALVDGLDVRTGPPWTARRVGRLAAEPLWLPGQLAGVDVVHHGGGTVPLRSPGPILLTIHDLQYRSFPQYFSTIRRRYLEATMPRSARRAAAIAVPSEYVRGTVVDAFGVPPEQVVVVPHGVDNPAAVTDEATLRARYHLGDRRVVVYPAITHPHKGHRFLLDVLATAWTDPDVVLVLLGGAGAADADVSAAIAAHGLGARVVRPGRVPSADRDGLVALAEALVFPSEYEGFGTPVLEAMALGTPVVCSDRASLPEVAGDAALVLPLAPDAWSSALADVAARRDELIERGRQRAGQFTTTASGRALIGAYDRAAGGLAEARS